VGSQFPWEYVRSYVTELTKHKFATQFFHSVKWDMNILFPNLHNYPGAPVAMCQYTDSFSWVTPHSYSEK